MTIRKQYKIQRLKESDLKYLQVRLVVLIYDRFSLIISINIQFTCYNYNVAKIVSNT